MRTCGVSWNVFESDSLTRGLKMDTGSVQGSRTSILTSIDSTRCVTWVLMILLAYAHLKFEHI